MPSHHFSRRGIYGAAFNYQEVAAKPREIEATLHNILTGFNFDRITKFPGSVSRTLPFKPKLFRCLLTNKLHLQARPHHSKSKLQARTQTREICSIYCLSNTSPRAHILRPQSRVPCQQHRRSLLYSPSIPRL